MGKDRKYSKYGMTKNTWNNWSSLIVEIQSKLR